MTGNQPHNQARPYDNAGPYDNADAAGPYDQAAAALCDLGIALWALTVLPRRHQRTRR